MSLDVAAQRTDFRREAAGYLRVEEGRVEVGSHLAHDETGPYVGEPFARQSCFEFGDEGVERPFVGQTAVHLLGSHLVGDFGQSLRTAEGFAVPDQLHRAGGHETDVDRLAGRYVDVHRRIDVDQIVPRQQRRFERALHPVHRGLGRPLLGALLVFEPRTAVVDGHDIDSVEVDGGGLHAHELHELVGPHPRVPAVAVDLIECRGEIDRRVVALGGTEGGLDDRRRIGTGGEEGATDAGFAFQLRDALQQFFGFCHNRWVLMVPGFVRRGRPETASCGSVVRLLRSERGLRPLCR